MNCTRTAPEYIILYISTVRWKEINARIVSKRKFCRKGGGKMYSSYDFVISDGVLTALHVGANSVGG